MSAALSRVGTINAARTRKRATPEADIQRAIVQYLEYAVPGVLVFAVPNAARRSIAGRAGNAVPGLRKGVADLCVILREGRVAFIEVKAEKGRLSEEQKLFLHDLTRRGIEWCVAKSVDDVRSFLRSIAVQTREAA